MSICSERCFDNIAHHSEDIVRVTDCGNVIEASITSFPSHIPNIVKLDKDSYIDTRTGEIKLFDHGDSRIDNAQSVRQSIGRFRRVVNANVTIAEQWRFLTLTYRENMTNTKKLYNDFGNFWKRNFHPAYPDAKYISAAEPQKRGAWHLHLLVGFPYEAPFIPSADVARMWKHGFVKVQSVSGKIDNIGAYLSAYLSNMALDEDDVPFPDMEGGTIPKNVIKGARLKLYPVGMRMFRWSKGIIVPETVEMSENELVELTGGIQPSYEQTKRISDTEANFDGIINYRQFKKGYTK